MNVGDDIEFEDLGEIEFTPESDEDILGGVGESKEQLTNIDGMSLNNPNYFERMYKGTQHIFKKT